jgi:hypothetical protein
MSTTEVFALTNVTGLHVFWLDPAQVRADLLRSPTIADATVQIGFPPNMVQIIIEEREPALVWEQAGVASWIDLQGRVMTQREDRPTLLRVTMDETVSGTAGGSIDAAIVTGAVQLHALLPNAATLRYHPDKGLGYTDARGWMVWFGVGADMQQKILIYNAIVEAIQARGEIPAEINIVNPDAPVYTTL